MHSIKQFLAFWYRIIPWIIKYPADSFSQRVKIFFDYIHLYRTKGLTRDEYHDYEFEKRSEEFRKDFLGWEEQGLYLKLLNPIKYYSLARNKYLSHRVLENTGVRKSKLYCYYEPEGRVFNSNEIASSTADVRRILKQKAVEQCVIKDTENSHGKGVIVVKKVEYLDNDCKLNYFNGKTAFLSDVLGKHPLIFESLIKQTAQFASFNASSVNTVRFMTVLYPNGEAKIIATFIKIGRAGNCVDNAGAGGNIDVCVDVATGEIKYAIQYDGWRKITEIEKHPDSGTQLNGTIINNWEQIKAEVIRFQQAMPWCKAAGWDIAITDEGPSVIEVNDSWDRTGQYFIRQGWRKEIHECYMLWKKTGYNPIVERGANGLSQNEIKKLEKMYRY